MLTFSASVRIVLIGGVVAGAAWAALDTGRPEGFGVVREGQSVERLIAEPDLAQRLVSLRSMLEVEPSQQAAWSLFASRMIDLDHISRRFEAQLDAKDPEAGAERARHALLFAVAFSDMEAALSGRQAAALRLEARALGRAFICAEVSGGRL